MATATATAQGEAAMGAPVLEPLNATDGMGRAAFETFQPLDRLPAARPTDVLMSVRRAAAFAVDAMHLSDWIGDAPHETVRLDDGQGLVISLPTPEGSYERFEIWQTDVMAPALGAQFEMIQTFVGQGLDDPTASLALDFTVQGMHGSVLSADKPDWYIDPYEPIRITRSGRIR